MKIFERIGAVCANFWRLLAGPAAPKDFTCGECHKRESCGLPPSDQCIARAAQIEEGYRRPIKL